MLFISLVSRKGFHREASTIKPFAFLKCDVAKLRRETRESKKMASTTKLAKSLINNELKNWYLYKGKKEHS